MLDVLERMSARYAHLAPDLWVEEVGVFRVGTGATHHVDIAPLAFTAAVVTTPITSTLSYDQRWCYADIPAALAAARAWLAEGFPEGEPAGWHRHPATGRRRAGGDPASEHVAL